METVYKSCGKCIVELQKLQDTLTNETRINVSNSNYAKFRGNKFLVKKIYDKRTKEEFKSIQNSIFKLKSITYEVNKVVETEFDLDLNLICSTGIHYFKTIEPAYHLDLQCENEIVKTWSENGELFEIFELRDGVRDGFYNMWHPRLHKFEVCEYKDGNIVDISEWFNLPKYETRFFNKPIKFKFS